MIVLYILSYLILFIILYPLLCTSFFIYFIYILVQHTKSRWNLTSTSKNINYIYWKCNHRISIVWSWLTEKASLIVTDHRCWNSRCYHVLSVTWQENVYWTSSSSQCIFCCQSQQSLSVATKQAYDLFIRVRAFQQQCTFTWCSRH